MRSQDKHSRAAAANWYAITGASDPWNSEAGILSLILSNTGEALILLDDQLQVRLFNDSAYRLVRNILDAELQAGKPFSDYFIPGFQTVYQASFEEALAGKVLEFEVNTAVLTRHDPHYFRMVLRPARDKDGTIAGIMVTCNDITENVGAKRKSLLHLQNIHLLLGNLRDAFVLVNRKLEVLWFNEVAAKGVRLGTGKLLQEGSHLLDYIEKIEKAEDLQTLIAGALAGSQKEQEFDFEWPGGMWMLLMKFMPAFDENNQVAGCIITAVNVTEARRQEKLLSNNEQSWRFALEGSNQGVWDWDIVNDRVFYSEAWCRMLGYSLEEMGQSMKDYEDKLHPDDREIMRQHRAKHLESSVSFYESEFRLLDKMGNFRWILSKGMIMERAADGTPLRMIGTHTDITDRKVVEEKYKGLFYKNPLPMWTYDRQTLRFLDVNDAAVSHYGYSLEEFQKMTILDIRPFEDRSLVEQEIAAASAHQQVQSGKWRHSKKDGSLIWVNVSGFTFQENFRAITLITAKDITQDIAAKRKLKTSEKLYRHLFQSIPLPAFIYDPENLRIQEANQSAVRHYGYSLSEFEQLNLLDLHVAEDQKAVLLQVQQNNNLREATIRQWRHRTKTGKELLVEVWGSNISLEGQMLRLVVINDITEKIQAEAELRASSERFHYVMNATNDIVWDWQIGSNKILWSNHYRDILGWDLPPDNYLPFSRSVACFHPDDRDRVLEGLEHALFNTKEVLWENAFRYKRRNGSYAYVLDKGFILRNSDGTAYRMIGAMHDISEEQYQQEVQELELRIFSLSSKPETKLQQVLENISGGLEQLHEHLRVCVVHFDSQNNTQIVARRLPEGLKQWMLRFTQEHKNKWLKSPLRKGLTTHSLSSADRKLLMTEWPGFEAMQVLSLPAINSDESLLAALVVFIGNNRGLSNAEWNALYRLQNLLRLLVVQHLSVEQIRLANERFDNVLKATHDLIWDWDLASGSFYRSPEALKRLYGIEGEKGITNVHDWLGRIHPDDHQRVQQVIERILKSTTDDAFDVEYRFLRDDGNYTFLYDRGIIIRNAQGTPVRMIGAAQDISERKRLELELLEQELDSQRVISQATIDTQEQERAEIGRELHDNVNQILTTTKLYLELAQSNHEMKDELVAKANKNIIHVINEIRQLSRSLMDPSIGDLGLIASIKDLTENINLTRKINIKVSTDDVLDNLLDESRKLMAFRIIQEAMSNIIRHSKATAVQIKLKKNGSNVLLQVKDNGIGFDPGEVKSGIGLKNIRNRVYLTHGNLQIIAAPGKGATLKILFPIQKSTR